MRPKVGEAATEPGRPKSRKLLLVILTGVVVLGAVVSIVWVQLDLGEPPEIRGLPIDNRTDVDLLIYGVNDDGTEVPIYQVQAHTRVVTDIGCARVELIARTSDGTEVARRAPSDQCDDEPWIIRGSS